MTSPFDDRSLPFHVLANREGQNSLWPAHVPVPPGWEVALPSSTYAACLDHVRSTWRDLRPRSVATAMTEADSPPTGGSLPDLFREQVKQHQDDIAVVGLDDQLTYGELDRRSDELAYALIASGVEPDARVAVLLDRSVDLVVAFIAVTKAGAAYAALSPEAPVTRLELMRERVPFSVVIVDHATATHPLVVDAQSRDLHVLRVDEPTTAARVPLPVVHPDQVAYVLHTSGSTGRPKGVAITHRSITDFTTDKVWGHDGSQRAVLMVAPPIFDGITYEVWVPLLSGGRIIVGPPGQVEMSDLAEFIRHSGATSAFLVPYVLNSLVEEDLDALGELEFIWSAGDVMSIAIFKRIMARFPHIRLFSAWGLTETTVVSSWYPASQLSADDRSVPIGKPMDNSRIHALDLALRPVPVGETGEAYVAGPDLAQGYEGAPDLTAERFVADPFGPPGSRMFRTGDLVRPRADGHLEFIGRVDRMVKIKGCRVEPAEVEAMLARSPAIAQVSVVVPVGANGEKHLRACVVPAVENRPSAAEIRQVATELLADYMVPDEFVLMDSMPLTSSGKVDRDSLVQAMQTVP
jgi:amino acid adenylation domain-containing protein